MKWTWYFPVFSFLIGAAIYFLFGLPDAFIQWWCGLTMLVFIVFYVAQVIRSQR